MVCAWWLGRADVRQHEHTNLYIIYIIKSIEFRGSALNDLRAFPQTAMREAGHQLDKVQNGLRPDDAKAMPSIGAGVVELRIWDEAGTFRVIYISQADGCGVRVALLPEKDPANRPAGY